MGKPPILKKSNVLRSVIQKSDYSATGFLATLFTKLFVALYFLYFGLFQADPHHDGYILGSAAAVSEGRNVHSGAFSQYGPMAPWVAGLFLKFTSVSVFNLTILSDIATTITFLLIEKVLRRPNFTQTESSLANVQRDWTEYNYEPLKGTYASQTQANSVNVYTPIYKYIQNEKAVFLCSDGIHAVATGKYAASNEWFVDWGRKDKDAQLAEMTRSNLVIMCDKKESEVRRISKLTGKEIEFFDEVEGDTYRSLAVLKKRVKP